jgi:molybdate transport system permease protein
VTDFLLGFDWTPVWLSFRVGLASMAIAVVVGTLLGWMLSHPGKRARVGEAAVLLPLVLPPTVLGYYLLVLIGRRGPIGIAWESLFGAPLVFTLNAAILAAAVATIPIVAVQMRAAFSSISPDTLEAARIDGAHGFRLLLHILLPQVTIPLAASASIAFARAIGDFGTTLMVAGSIPGRTQTASLAIYERLMTQRDDEALFLVIIISLICLIALIAANQRLGSNPAG